MLTIILGPVNLISRCDDAITIGDDMTLQEINEQVDAMLAAADGYADDELVWFGDHQWSAGRLRELADDMIDFPERF